MYEKTRERIAKVEAVYLIEGDGFSVVQKLAKQLNVSYLTIRRDFKIIRRKMRRIAEHRTPEELFDQLDAQLRAAFVVAAEAKDARAMVTAVAQRQRLHGLDNRVITMRPSQPATPDQIIDQLAQLPPAVRHAILTQVEEQAGKVITITDRASNG